MKYFVLGLLLMTSLVAMTPSATAQGCTAAGAAGTGAAYCDISQQSGTCEPRSDGNSFSYRSVVIYTPVGIAFVTQSEQCESYSWFDYHGQMQGHYVCLDSVASACAAPWGSDQDYFAGKFTDCYVAVWYESPVGSESIEERMDDGTCQTYMDL